MFFIEAYGMHHCLCGLLPQQFPHWAENRGEIEQTQKEYNVKKDTTQYYIVNVRNTDINDPLNDTTFLNQPIKFVSVPDIMLSEKVKQCKDVIDSILHEKVYYFETNRVNSSAIHFYFQNNLYHFYPVRKQRDFTDFDKARTWSAFCGVIKKYSKYCASNATNQSQVLDLDRTNYIVPFNKDFLVFNTDTTFYNISSTSNKVFGPFVIHDLRNFVVFGYGGYENKQLGSVYKFFFDVVLKPSGGGQFHVNYNFKTGDITTNIAELNANMEKEIRRNEELHKKYIKDSLSRAKSRQEYNDRLNAKQRSKVIGPLLIFALLFNSFLVLRSYRKSK